MKILITAVLLLFSTSLLASGLFGGGDTTNIHNTPIAVGGTGGQGGQGGLGGKGGIGIGKGGNADSRSTALAAAAAKAHAASVAKQEQEQKQLLLNAPKTKLKSDIDIDGPTLSFVEEAQKRNPVSTAIAPALTAGIHTCMGSSSVGGQGVGVGFSFGTTWTDEHCKMLKASGHLASIGLKKASVSRLCSDPEMARALQAEGQGYCETPAVGGGEGEIPYLVDATDDYSDLPGMQ